MDPRTCSLQSLVLSLNILSGRVHRAHYMLLQTVMAELAGIARRRSSKFPIDEDALIHDALDTTLATPEPDTHPTQFEEQRLRLTNGNPSGLDEMASPQTRRRSSAPHVDQWTPPKTIILAQIGEHAAMSPVPSHSPTGITTPSTTIRNVGRSRPISVPAEQGTPGRSERTANQPIRQKGSAAPWPEPGPSSAPLASDANNDPVLAFNTKTNEKEKEKKKKKKGARATSAIDRITLRARPTQRSTEPLAFADGACRVPSCAVRQAPSSTPMVPSTLRRPNVRVGSTKSPAVPGLWSPWWDQRAEPTENTRVNSLLAASLGKAQCTSAVRAKAHVRPAGKGANERKDDPPQPKVDAGVAHVGWANGVGKRRNAKVTVTVHRLYPGSGGSTGNMQHSWLPGVELTIPHEYRTSKGRFAAPKYM